MTIEFQIHREQLVKPLQALCGVSEKRQDNPILGHVCFEGEGSKLRLTGTDLDICLLVEVPLTEPMVKGGKTTLPARKLLDVCRTLPEDTILFFKQEESKMLIKASHGRYALSVLDADQFPKIEFSHQKTTHFSATAAVLKRLLESTSFAMAQQDVRFYLNGMLIDLDQENIRLIATDGHRLALTEASGSVLESSEALKIILPRKAVLEFSRLLEDEQKEVHLQVSSSLFEARFSNYIFYSKLIDGRFPDYRSVVLTNGNKTVVFDREWVRQSLQRVSVLFNEKFRGIRLMLEKGKITISASNQEREEAIEQCPADYEGDTIEIGFNVRYLLDVLNAMRSKRVKMICQTPSQSVLFQDHDDPNTQFVIMPMRL